MAELEQVTLEETPTPKLASPTEIQARAQELKDRITLPKKPGTRVLFREMKDWFNLLTPEMEEQIMIYMYRLDPPIVRQKVNPDALNNIDVIGSGFKELTEQYIIDTQGGGKYQLVVKNVGYKARNKGDDTGYFECMVSIPYILHKPKMVHIDGCGLDLREVSWDDPKCQSFKAWAIANSYVDKVGNIVDKTKEVQTQTNSTDAMVPVMKMMMDFVSKMSEKDQQHLKKQIGGEDALTKSMGDLMLEKMKQDDPGKQVGMITSLITAIMTKQGSNDGGLGVMIPMFVQMMQSQQASADRQFQMMMGLLTKEKESGGDEKVDEIGKLRMLLEVAKEIKGGGGSTHEKSTAEIVAQTVSDSLPNILNIGANLIALFAANKGIKPVPPTGDGIPRTAVEAMNEANKHNVHNPNPNPQPQQETRMISPPNEELLVMKQFAPLIFSNLGKDGWEVADMTATLLPQGELVVARIIKSGVDGIIELMKQIGVVQLATGSNDFWQAVMSTYGEPHLRKWLDEFCRYKEIIAEVEAEEKKVN